MPEKTVSIAADVPTSPRQASGSSPNSPVRVRQPSWNPGAGDGEVWYWLNAAQSKAQWVSFPKEESVALESKFVEYMKAGGRTKRAATGRRSLDQARPGDDVRVQVDDDHTVSFFEMKQFRTYGDPSWFREIYRGQPPGAVVAPLLLEKGKKKSPRKSPRAEKPGGPHPPKGPGRQRSRTLADRRSLAGWGSASNAADAWVKEGAVRKNEAARRAKAEVRRDGATFDLSVLPCQDRDYQAVSSDMEHWFKLADGEAKAVAEGRPKRTYTKPQTPENLRHLQRSVRQAQLYKGIQGQSSVDLNAAGAAFESGFDMVECFSAAAVQPAVSSASSNLSSAWKLPRQPANYSRSARAPAAPRVDPSPHERWSAREFGTNWSQTKKPQPPPKTVGQQHLAAVTQSHSQQSIKKEKSWSSVSEASGWAQAVLGPSAADAGTERAGALPPIPRPVGVGGEIQMSGRPRIVYKFSPRFGTFNVA